MWLHTLSNNYHASFGWLGLLPEFGLLGIDRIAFRSSGKSFGRFVFFGKVLCLSKVIPQYCIAHPYCASLLHDFLRSWRAHINNMAVSL